ncbi:C58 family peptidase [Myxococcus stipitatus]|uniref:YopT-type cysteine protease domain-containing protein n=1 Tax=Myxococcus stipitatus TaxID=83455 RepID=UPI003144E2A3
MKATNREELYRETLTELSLAHRHMAQRAYDKDGVCLSLACRWIREIHAADIWMGWSLKQSPTDRLARVLLDIRDVVVRHKAYLAQRDANEAKVAQLRAWDLVRREAAALRDAKLSEGDNAAFVEAVKQARGWVAQANGSWVTQPERALAQAYGLGLEGVGSWALGDDDAAHATLTKALRNLPTSTAHLVLWRGTGAKAESHAVGLYKTHGAFWQDWYVFDPNFGEFKFNSLAKAATAVWQTGMYLGMNSVRLVEARKSQPAAGAAA